MIRAGGLVVRSGAVLVGAFLVAGPLSFAALTSPAVANEAEIANRLCAGLAREVPTGGRSRADCADETRAIEIDFSHHWAASLGQALYYGRALGLRPTVVLICEDGALDGPFAGKCREHAFRAAYGARGAADVLLCAESAETFEDCQTGGE